MKTLVMKELVLVCAAFALGACAHHRHMNDMDSSAGASAGAAPVSEAHDMPSPAEMAKLASPSAGHERLATLVGNWRHTVTMWMGPDAKPQIMNGTNVNHWILGKRFLMQEAHGGDKKNPFQGLGITGYDNIRGEYTSIWIDNMNTGMMKSVGAFDSAINGIREAGTLSCPMTGDKERPFRAEWSVSDSNHYTYTMFMQNRDGSEFKSVEVSYERVGSGGRRVRSSAHASTHSAVHRAGHIGSHVRHSGGKR